MRRDHQEAREQLEYLFERFGGDPEWLFDDAEVPQHLRQMLKHAECLLRTGDNDLATTLIRCVAVHSTQLELEFTPALEDLAEGDE